MSDIENLKRQILASVAQAKDEAALERLRVAALGKKGSVSELLKSLGTMSLEKRKVQGPLINGLRDEIGEMIAARKRALEDVALEARLVTERVDITLPAPEFPRGMIHPISQVEGEVTAILADLGFTVAEGPDVESDDYNFTKLNMPPEHPARQMHDTFYMKAQKDGSRPVLRTHTSPVQVRTMLSQKPPLRIIAPGLLLPEFGGPMTATWSPSRKISPRRPSCKCAAICAECSRPGPLVTITVAVVDRAGLPRMIMAGDTASPHNWELARRKAYTARTYRRPSLEWAERTAGDSEVAGQRMLADVVPLGGGMPIMIGDEPIGGVGVSGAMGGQPADQACAQAAIAAIADELQ